MRSPANELSHPEAALAALHPRPRADMEALAKLRYDVIVVGAGHNGLTAAAYLSRLGLRVLVLEERDRLGGACTLESPWPGTFVSPCAYLCGLLHPLVISDLGLREHGFSWSPAAEGLFVPFPDGRCIQLYEDEELCLAEVRRLCPEDVEGFRAYSQTFAELREALRPDGPEDIWLDLEPTRSGVLARTHGVALAREVLFDWSMQDLVNHFFRSELLQKAYLGQGVIGTAAPPSRPGTAFVHFHHSSGRMEGKPGVWGYVRGGMGAVSAQLLSVAQAAGLTSLSGVRACRIEYGSVEVEGGFVFQARAVICGFDPAAALRLVTAHVPEDYRGLIERIPRRGMTAKLTLLLRELPDFLARPGAGEHHRGQLNTPLSAAEWEAGFAAAESGELPERLWTELYIQTATEQALAPAGRHIMSVFSEHVPHEFAHGDWGTRRGDVADRILTTLGGFCRNIPDAVEQVQLLGPPDIERETGLPGGHIFQGEILPEYMWEGRPNVRTPVGGLYLCGAGTNPGGSVMGVNGRNAARAVAEDLGVTWRWV